MLFGFDLEAVPVLDTCIMGYLAYSIFQIELVWAIICTFMHGFLNILAQLLSLKSRSVI